MTPDVHLGAGVPVYNLVGIGFGPSNLALSIAVDEHNRRASGRAAQPLTMRFLEKQPRFAWHRGMLIDDATMQVSFLKDLVTPRNPSSDFSFISYLHQHGRLADFINHKILFPLRIEFHDYLEWAAARMEHLVEYGRQVVDVQPVTVDGEVTAFDVVAQGRPGTTPVVRRAQNVVVAVGLELSLPPEADLSERVWHNLDLLDRVEALPAEPPPRRFAVVGAGQSAAEVAAFLHRRFPQAEVCAVFSRYGYTLADDSPFANRIFDPDAVDLYFGAPPAVKRMLFDYHRNTNYSVVDIDLIEELYRRVYQERVLGRQRLRILNASRVIEVVDRLDAVRVTVQSLPTAERMVLDCDAIIYATGYRPADALTVLGAAGPLCRVDDGGRVRVRRDYRVETTTSMRAAIYLQGGTEHAHGITATLLSNIAIRAGEIVQSVVERSRPESAPTPPLALAREHT